VSQAAEKLAKIIDRSGKGSRRADLILLAMSSTLYRIDSMADDDTLLDAGHLSFNLQPETRALHADGAPLPLKFRVAQPGEIPSVWVIPSGRAYVDRDFALKSAFMETDDYREAVRTRYRLGHIVRAKAQTLADYIANGGEQIFFDERDTYVSTDCFANGEADVEGHSFAYGCTTSVGVDLDLAEALENWLSDAGVEDASLSDLDDVDSILNAYRAWREKQAYRTWMVDLDVIVILDPAKFAIELAEAQAFFVANPSIYPWECPAPVTEEA
jgi:hypothetical protein